MSAFTLDRLSRRAYCAVLLCIATAGAARAQFPDAIPFRAEEGVVRTGFQFFSGSVYGSRSTSRLDGAAEQAASTYRDSNVGASLSAGWSRALRGGTLGLNYSGMYGTRPDAPGLSSDSHYGSVRWSTALTPRLNWSANLQAGLWNRTDLLFTSAVYSEVAATGISWDPTTSAFSLNGNYTSNQIASMLTGAPVVNSAAQTFAFGNRALTTSLSTTASYNISPITSISVTLGFSRFDALANGGNQVDLQNAVDLTGRSGGVGFNNSFSSGSARLSLTRNISSRTNIGVDFNMERTFSANQDAYINTANYFINRTLTPNLIAQVSIGGGYVKPVKRTPDVIDRPAIVAQGGLTWKVYQQSLSVNVDRTLADFVGLGANTFTSYNGSWTWSPPRSRWYLQARGGLEQMDNPRFGRTNAVTTGGSVMRRLAANLNFSVEYTRVQSSLGRAIANSTDSDFQMDGLRVALVFIPSRGPSF